MQLHEQTQRFILLLIFYLFGPILTLGIIGGIMLRKLPSNARSWEQSLILKTGLRWTIQTVEYRSPCFVRLHDFQILDDAAQALFIAPKIEVRLVTDTRWEKIFPGIPLISDPEPSFAWNRLTGLLVNAFPSFRSANQFWQITVPVSILNFDRYSNEDSARLVQNMLHKFFARLTTLSDVPVQLVLEQIAVISEYSLIKNADKIEEKIDLFRFVQGNIYRTNSEIRSDWSFQIKDVSDLDVEHLSFVLSPTDSVEISFKTGKQPIPCDLAAVFCPLFKHFYGGTFQGEFSLTTHNGSVQTPTIRLNKVCFKCVPLAPLVKPYTHFAVEGTVADLQLQQAFFGTEAPYAEGCLQVLNGAVESALFNRCVDNFRLTVEPVAIVDSPMRMIPFSECAIHFRLQQEGIRFWADQRWFDAFMYQEPKDGSGMVVRLPRTNRERIVTYHELMSIFVPDSAPVVPLTHGLKSILSIIPVP